MSRRVRHFLTDYDIDKFACFFYSNGRYGCYYVDRGLTAFDILEQTRGEWRSVLAEVNYRDTAEANRDLADVRGALFRCEECGVAFPSHQYTPAAFPCRKGRP